MTYFLLLLLIITTGLWLATIGHMQAAKREAEKLAHSVLHQPLVWTTKGNLPGSALEYRTDWFEDDNEITFVEQYWLDGEMVKSSTHKRLKKGVEALGYTANLG